MRMSMEKSTPWIASKHSPMDGVGDMKVGAEEHVLEELKMTIKNCRGMLLSGVKEEELAKSSI